MTPLLCGSLSQSHIDHPYNIKVLPPPLVWTLGHSIADWGCDWCSDPSCPATCYINRDAHNCHQCPQNTHAVTKLLAEIAWRNNSIVNDDWQGGQWTRLFHTGKSYIIFVSKRWACYMLMFSPTMADLQSRCNYLRNVGTIARWLDDNIKTCIAGNFVNLQLDPAYATLVNRTRRGRITSFANRSLQYRLCWGRTDYNWRALRAVR